MTLLIGAGTVVSVIGLMGLLLCIGRVAQAKKNAENEEALRHAIRTVLPLNLGSLFLSALGLMTIVVGIMLGP